MPSWELFETQDEAYRKEVLGKGTVRVAVEAAVRLGWDRYIGEDGGFVGMSGFGASGAETDLYEHFGITAGKVVEEVRKQLQGTSSLVSRHWTEAPAFPSRARLADGLGSGERMPSVVVHASFGIGPGAGRADLTRTNQGGPDLTTNAFQESDQHSDESSSHAQ